MSCFLILQKTPHISVGVKCVIDHCAHEEAKQFIRKTDPKSSKEHFPIAKLKIHLKIAESIIQQVLCKMLLRGIKKLSLSINIYLWTGRPLV